MRILLIITLVSVILTGCDKIGLSELVPTIEFPKGTEELEKPEGDPAHEEINLVRRHEAVWAGLHVGDLITEIKPEGEGYRFKALLRTHGLAKLISKYKCDVESTIGYDGENYYPIEWETSFKMRKSKREIAIKYDDDGKTITSETNEPPEKRWKRKEVPAELKTGTYDPLTMALVARQKIIEVVEGKGDHTFSVPFYDGRRHGSFDFTVHGQTKDKLIHVSFTEVPIAGYTDNEMKTFGEQGKLIEMYLSPDDFFPVKSRGYSILGTATAYLAEECETIEECWE